MVNNKFHVCFSQFIEELSIQFPTEPSLQLVKTIIKDVDSDELVQKYRSFILPYKDMIEKKDENFFLNSNEWFYKLTSPAKIFSIKDLWVSETLDDEDKDMIWQWFNVFNRIVLTN